MATNHPGSSPKKSSRLSVKIAQRNLKRCLEAYDKNGEEGLEKTLSSIYPSGSERMPLHLVLGDGSSLITSQSLTPSESPATKP
ncbi:MAG: hypothetical protein ABSH56_35335 [Bryobacteraceae bacterium]|jgi:hypothetical protein